MRKFLLLSVLFAAMFAAQAQNILNNPGSNHGNKFEQLGTILPTANEYRTASGAPGTKYWQQRCDYNIKCELDEKNLKLTGSETVTYYNNSPDILSYLWLQLDENQHSTINNAGYETSSTVTKDVVDLKTVKALDEAKTDNGYGHIITKLTNANGQKLNYTINKTMLRIDLPAALKPGQQFVFNIDWSYKIPDQITMGGRGGYEYFPEDGNHIFTMAQWYPRLCVYSDFQGWQNQQFSGSAEFALTFGNFNVQMTVPADHVIMSTGECRNYASVLSAAQQQRWTKAQQATEPTEVVTLEEAKAAEKNKSDKKKTWIFSATNVRDFAWGSSRKFIWDAMPVYVEGKKIMCMSGYGKEAYGLYKKFSTKAVAHAIKTYSKFTIAYPYPVAQSIEASNGMEYPMICFNYGRTEKDGTYTEATKNGMLGVIIHEVGHNFFPMIVNSDERQWSWMDEGLNSFVQYLAEQLYDNKFPSKRGSPSGIVDYMRLPKDQLEPIMTNSDNINQFGWNAYGKPAVGLNILRETVMGRERFDFAFKEYSKRWAFKHPTPADFFRTLEDASADDLDWFWRGWFYGIEPCDISMDSIKHVSFDMAGEVGMNRVTTAQNIDRPLVPTFDDLTKQRNRNDPTIKFLVDTDTSLRDFYWKYDRGIIPYDSISKIVPKSPTNKPENLTASEKANYANKHLYEISFTNKGGLVMPIIVQFTFEDGTTQTEKVAAQIWRKNEKNVTKVFITDKPATSIVLDPMKETADIDISNNSWPKLAAPSKVALYKIAADNRRNPEALVPNPMQNAQKKN
jgi:hypothetical protein